MLTMWLLLIKDFQEPDGEESQGGHGADVDEEVQLRDVRLLVALLRADHKQLQRSRTSEYIHHSERHDPVLSSAHAEALVIKT